MPDEMQAKLEAIEKLARNGHLAPVGGTGVDAQRAMSMVEGAVAASASEEDYLRRRAEYGAKLPYRMRRVARQMTEHYRAILPDGVRFEWGPAAEPPAD